MPIKVTCENCGGGLLARTADAGRRIKCPKCGAGMTVLDADPTQAGKADPEQRRERTERTGRTEGRRNRRKKVMLILYWGGLWAVALAVIWVGLKVFVK